MELEKCSQLVWTDVEDLPEDLTEDRKDAIRNYLAGVPYREEGWY